MLIYVASLIFAGPESSIAELTDFSCAAQLSRKAEVYLPDDDLKQLADLAPKGVWDTISRFLYDIELGFIDSKYFCAMVRKRGYVHNLPKQILSCSSSHTHPSSKHFPCRESGGSNGILEKKLNCIQTALGCVKLTERIRNALERFDGDPPTFVQKSILGECH
ncbi:DNA (cytosine-5)-methyltransferase DRM2-like isoform X1 [Olea europaea subsp. europaea]|uniref:DNA (Cytosine-5)-methyltransferase DRM2-like isoform X1 n=1 Tax=Olea europaea subsp. europaea TaxID=158383 RepID=A0A8S0T4C6_OLEEU|nr:DNA (cytosine-5)-methyltransferase DRM2-like isoform X1 [Olea europaea subsp. europaea]